MKWDEETARLVEWFLSAQLPTEPFVLATARRITDPVKFYEALRVDLEIGPGGPRARYGILQRDVRLLHQMFGGEVSAGPAQEAPGIVKD